MFNAFGKLWLKSAKRLAKSQAAQQRTLQKKLTKRLVKSLVPAVKKPRTRASTLKTAAAPGLAMRKGIAAPAGPGGSWSRSYYVAPQRDARGRQRRLTYWLFLPPTEADALTTGTASLPGLTSLSCPPKPLPLVIMLHGCDQTAPDFASGTRMNLLAERHGFAVLYPQQSASAHPQRCWPWYRRSLQEGGDEIALIAGLTEKTIIRHRLDATRVYVAGLSAGAAMAHVLALRHPHLIAAVGLHSGPVYGAADSRMRAFSVMQHGTHGAAAPIEKLLAQTADFPPMPAMIVQGLQDAVVRPVNAAQLVEQFCALNGMAAAVHEPTLVKPARGRSNAHRTTDYQRDGRTMIRLCQVEQLAHAWSGGNEALRYNAAQGPDASRAFWDFFKRHRRIAPLP